MMRTTGNRNGDRRVEFPACPFATELRDKRKKADGAAESSSKQACKVGFRILPSTSKEIARDESWLRAERIITQELFFICGNIRNLLAQPGPEDLMTAGPGRNWRKWSLTPN